MFASLYDQLTERLTQIQEVWLIIERLESNEINTHITEPGLRTLKGLIFVQFYSVYEFIVVNSFAAVVREFNSHAISFDKLKRSILSLTLHEKIVSLSNSSERRSWKKRIEIFEHCESSINCAISDDLFPFDHSHFRTQQLQTICQLLGLPENALISSPPIHGWVDEVVENRNAIAHGRLTAEAVGSRYSSAELNDRMEDLGVFCNHILNTLETYSSDVKEFCK